MQLLTLCVKEGFSNGASQKAVDFCLYVAIACDCAAPDRIAGEEWFRRAAVRVTLDHHETNPGYGDIGCIETLSSCAEMIAEMMDSDELVPVAQRAHEQGLRTAADYLYLGILHDTRRFSHISGGRTLGVAAKLLFGGVDHDELVKTMDVRTLRECCHQGGLLAQARTAADGRVGYLCLSAAQAAELQVSYEDMKKAAYQMADCSDIRIALAALEQGPGHWRFSARTNETELDVSRYFLPFGGGGHPHAAGLILDTADVRPALQSILNAMAADLAAEKTHLTGGILE